jgi:hypothetical protein
LEPGELMSDATPPSPKPALAQPQTVTDSLGRTLTLKKLDALAELDLIEAAGGTNSDNRRWMVMATLAACVAAIDGTPAQPLASREAIRAHVKLVGSEGLDAVMASLTPDETVAASDDTVAATAKNSPGTP